jgi:hypothetical protein
MNDAPRAELGDEEGEERTEEHVMDLQEVAGPDAAGVILEEGWPGLAARSRWPCGAHIPLNCTFRDLDAKLQQLALDPLCTPQAIASCDFLDQRDRLRWNSWFWDLARDFRFQKS